MKNIYLALRKKKYKVKNIMLHAYKIKFMINDIKYNFEASFDSKIKNFLKLKL